MARRNRIYIDSVPQHILIKSIEGLYIFNELEEYEVFFKYIKELSTKYSVSIHAYIITPTLFQFVATPKFEDSIPRFMQNIAQKYVKYYNKKYNRNGTIWNGRYKASLVDKKKYLKKVIQYIEQIPVQENIVKSISDYKYSSKSNEKVDLLQGDKDFIKSAIEKQLITADSDYIKHIEQKIGESLAIKKPGRPKKKYKEGNIMYKKLVVLDKQKHNLLKISQLENLNFAKKQNLIPVVVDEVGLMNTDFPIVFTSDDNPSIVAVSSLVNKNIAISENGKWTKKYIPSYYRKYPFALTALKDKPDQKVVAIDIESDVVNEEKGSALFAENLEQTDFLKNAIQILTQHEQLAINTLSIAKRISDAKILEEREITIGEGEDKKVLAKGFKVVNRDLLNKLDDATLAQWVRDGIINLIEAHLKSLDNFEKIMTN